MTTGRILILDDEPEIALFLSRVAKKVGYEADAFTTFDEFLAELNEAEPLCILMDLQMPEVDGIEVLRRLAERSFQSEIVIMSGMDEKILDSARRLGRERGLNISGTIQKPFSAEDVISVLSGMQKKPSGDTIDLASIDAALNDRQMLLYYQPKVSLQKGYQGPMGPYNTTGFEALLRWNHPTLGILGPDKFLPLAEENGLMGKVTEFVIDCALEQMADWNAAGLDTSVAINVSAHNMQDARFADRLNARCSLLGVRTETLIVELTETAAMADPVTAMDILTRLRLKGFRLAIDDFGTGYSSLVQLQNLPFSQLKIDRAFVRDCDSSNQSRTIVKTMVDLSKNLGLISVAEGVENAQVIEYIREIGCDIAQGYAVSKPLPPDAATEWLRAAPKLG